MFEPEIEEKVAIETQKKPVIVCGFLGVFWNICSAAHQVAKAPAEENVPPETKSEPFCDRNTCTTAAAPEAEKKVLLENFEYLHVQGSRGASRKIHYGPEDHLGSTRMVLDQDGTIKQALMYQPYGTIAPVDGIPGTGSDPLRQKFTTKEFDEDGENSENGAPGIGWFYFGARYLDPDLGIWNSTDPANQFFNAYSYAGGNVTGSIDPDGRMSKGLRKFLNVLYYISNPVDYFQEVDKRGGEKGSHWDPTRDAENYYFGWSFGDESGPVTGDIDGGTMTYDIPGSDDYDNGGDGNSNPPEKKPEDEQQEEQQSPGGTSSTDGVTSTGGGLVIPLQYPPIFVTGDWTKIYSCPSGDCRGPITFTDRDYRFAMDAIYEWRARALSYNKEMVWSGVKDIGWGTGQLVFGTLLLATAVAQGASPTGVTQVTGLATGAAGAYFTVNGVGSIGMGGGKISLGLQNPKIDVNDIPSGLPGVDVLFLPGYPQATEDYIRRSFLE